MSPSISIPRFSLPPFIATIGQHLPQWPHTLALVAGLNTAVRLRLLTGADLSMLEDKLFRVRVLDTGGTATFTCRGALFHPVLRPQREPDLCFAAKLSAYLQLLARQEDPDTLFFNRELEITGDTELGLTVKNMLDAVEWPQLVLPFARKS
ncbi:MAG TPA: SCP2 sterol-binding domain-containing protein [Rhodocyclaceae bacterium]|jgi:predicted lipid carrier protein YhbT|nr:SCP2 sterol-binding domain-containing protein [Rhodocyclaceae bacterium]HMW76355.1 SCP2 sterol-binding domain-containing protein [Rhodocyclaceae bacterium]HNE43968.1 SCP2 sterol-binding domain-containing protein [Rhodocyclaceae bacterium]HNM20882.1 SCP2 sterol-binding domain-containing protein [Rhodocyclaceae bacterium]HNM80221.1 SCP2 sterol-binding domain-containing protein [Rhodocyclaceae bacterium]